MKNLRTLLQYKYTYIVLLVLVLIYSLYVTNFIEFKSKYDINTNKINGYIHDFSINGNILSLRIKGKEKIIGNYIFKTKKEMLSFRKKYKLGDYIIIYGTLNVPKGKSVFNLFDYKKYLLQEKIYYSISIDNFKKYKNNNKIIYNIKQKIIDRIEEIKKSKHYLYAFILGEDSYVLDSVKESYQVNGISHLFAISGSNISLLVLILMILIKKIRIKYIIIFIFLYSYMFITNFCPSIVRAGIFFILLYINKGLKLNIKTINILWLTLFVSLLSNPFLIYNVGFEYSFIISMYLILYKDIIMKYKSKILNLFFVSLIAFLSSLPITLNNFYQINLLSIFLNLLFVPFVSIIVFPLSLICFILPIFDNVLLFLINIMEYLSLFFSKINIFVLTIGKPPLIILSLYYLVITYCLNEIKNNNYIYLMLIPVIIVINYYTVVCTEYPEITFINVGQGDSILIRLQKNKGNILVDTGGIIDYDSENWEKKNNKFSIGKDIILSYMKSMGMNHLDYLFITHGDYDHIGESNNIINNIKINNVVINSGNVNLSEKQLIKISKEKNIKYIFGKEGDIIYINKYSFYLLNPHIKSNENDDSIVLYFSFNDKNILLMGDAGINVEKYLINKYELNVDVLKVGHHGSNTSSSEKFIKTIKPKYAIISVGLKNKFGHPNKNVIKTLDKNKVKTYLTSIDGSIKLIFRPNDVTILRTGT